MTKPTFESAFAELSAAVRLDKADLDNQLCEHAELFRRVCELLAEKEDEYALVAAEVDRELRDEAEAAKVKITEVEISRRMALEDRVGRLKLQVNRIRGLKEAYVERRHAFGKLVDLYGQQYWSEPSGSSRTVARDTNRERIRQTNRSSREER